MSIPPLVCSTPPPPDQCEDDKDPEYFELPYNLSQGDENEDDDDNDYNYGNFTPYNHFQTSAENNPLEIKEQNISNNTISEIPKEIILKYENIELEHNITCHSEIGINDINEEKSKCEDDVNVEDLNLKVDEEIESNAESNNEQIEVTNQHVDEGLDIPSSSKNDNPACDIPRSTLYASTLDAIDAHTQSNSDINIRVPQPCINSHVEAKHIKNNTNNVLQDNLGELAESEKLEKETGLNNKHIEQSSKAVDNNLIENVTIDDDFGDFDDFQSVNVTSNVVNIVENGDDPWDNDDSTESDFGNFTANFEDTKFENASFTPVDSVSISIKLKNNETVDANNELNDIDDFGDFDDFKSSIKAQCNEFTEFSQSDELPEINLQATENEHQILERIATVLSSVFLEEISVPEDKFDGKLESLLSETWGHLMETDERQPYIVNWNNSFGQKTLLRALCIDSRNILFGPKWSNNMPKYAANLSNAPLQPQKQASTITQNEIIPEKSTSTPTSWSDPVTSDSQESCNSENQSAAKPPVSTDLSIFEAGSSTKPKKIFSNTIGVQPLRQINLPDTHIFTPTDSEIPRSKTIHYDLTPTVLSPQPALEATKSQTDTRNTHNESTPVENNNEVDDNEYWEFQNFKDPSDASTLCDNNNSQPVSRENHCETATIINALPQPSVAHQTELLQPIKIEPAIPTLNWPDPGEVKGVFDDFSDFVSISSQSIKKPDNSSLPVEFQLGIETVKPTNTNELPVAITTITHTNTNEFDDDFDTFQSAPPSKSIGNNLDNNYSDNINQICSLEFDRTAKSKSDSISFTNTTKLNEALTQNVGYMDTTELNTNKNLLPLGSQLQGNLLQPTSVSFSTVPMQSQQKSGQILQPLSLESYSQINWPSPGIDLQDLSRFNPVETLHSLKSEASVSTANKGASPIHSNQVQDDDAWGEFVSSRPKLSLPSQPKKPPSFVDDDEWTDFISSPSMKPPNGLNTISLNVHTNSNMHKSVQNKFVKKPNQPPIDIPSLNYITPKSNPHRSYNDKHFQNL